jgi:hypothetical protein
MKWTVALLLFVLNVQAQKVVKPKGNTKEQFSLTINNENYKTFVEAFINKDEYKQLWLNYIKTVPENILLANKGNLLSAKVEILVSISHDGKVFIESHNSSSGNEISVSNDSLGIVVNKIRKDLRKIVKKKGIVTPSYSKSFNGYVNDEVVIEQVWVTTL